MRIRFVIRAVTLERGIINVTDNTHAVVARFVKCGIVQLYRAVGNIPRADICFPCPCGTGFRNRFDHTVTVVIDHVIGGIITVRFKG